MLDTMENSRKDVIVPECLLRSMHEPTGFFRNRMPFNPCNFLSSSSFSIVQMMEIRFSQLSGPGLEPWVSTSVSWVLITPVVLLSIKNKTCKKNKK